MMGKEETRQKNIVNYTSNDNFGLHGIAPYTPLHSIMQLIVNRIWFPITVSRNKTKNFVNYTSNDNFGLHGIARFRCFRFSM